MDRPTEGLKPARTLLIICSSIQPGNSIYSIPLPDTSGAMKTLRIWSRRGYLALYAAIDGYDPGQGVNIPPGISARGCRQLPAPVRGLE